MTWKDILNMFRKKRLQSTIRNIILFFFFLKFYFLCPESLEKMYGKPLTMISLSGREEGQM